MALLCHAAGGSAVFCFHDDNFLLPRPEDSLARVRAIRDALESYGVGTVGLVGKCRPDSLTPDLARELRALGVVRLYVGVENVAQAGSDHLGRRVRVEQVDRALRACQQAGIFGCYNLLLFEPDATLEDVEQNVAFIRAHDTQPVNFCRVEPYCGTPLQQDLEVQGRLRGSFLGYDYRIADDHVEALFRVCAAAFRERNFGDSGVHNRYMGLGYYVSLLERFYDDPVGVTALAREAEALTRSITLESADFLDEAIRIVRHGLHEHDRLERETADLALRIAAADRVQHARLDELYATLHSFAESTPLAVQRPAHPAPKLAQLVKRVAQGVSVSAWLAGWAMGMQGCDDRTAVDPAPPDGGADLASDAGQDVMIVDPPPMDMGRDAPVPDPLPPDAGQDVMIVDPPPMDMGRDAPIVDPLPPDLGRDVLIGDPAPLDRGVAPAPDNMVVDMLPPDAGAQLQPESDAAALDTVASHWRDTSPRRVVRSNDLPLFDPPVPQLSATRDAHGVRVILAGAPVTASLRWQCEGNIDGEGNEVLWRPASDDDQISIGVRTRGGIAVLSLRLKDIA
jgi:hypothetical protein